MFVSDPTDDILALVGDVEPVKPVEPIEPIGNAAGRDGVSLVNLAERTDLTATPLADRH